MRDDFLSIYPRLFYAIEDFNKLINQKARCGRLIAFCSAVKIKSMRVYNSFLLFSLKNYDRMDYFVIFCFALFITKDSLV